MPVHPNDDADLTRREAALEILDVVESNTDSEGVDSLTIPELLMALTQAVLYVGDQLRESE